MDGPCTSRDVTSDEDIVNLNTTSSASDKPVERLSIGVNTLTRDDIKNAETLPDETVKQARAINKAANYGKISDVLLNALSVVYI
jgi:hypothetical protein